MWNNALAPDECPSFEDINPFILALSNPDGYAVAFPGIGELPMIYHGDCNCSGAFDFADINAFVAIIEGESCDPNCGQRDSEDPPQMTPLELAVELDAHVLPGLRPQLRAIIAEAIPLFERPATGAYWHAVRERLPE